MEKTRKQNKPPLTEVQKEIQELKKEREQLELEIQMLKERLLLAEINIRRYSPDQANGKG